MDRLAAFSLICDSSVRIRMLYCSHNRGKTPMKSQEGIKMKKFVIRMILMLVAVNAVILLVSYAADKPFIYNFFLNLAIPAVAVLACWGAEREGKPGLL